MSVNGYLSSENLTETANDLEQFLSNKYRAIVTLLPLLRRQAEVKTTRYTIKLFFACHFLAVSLNKSLNLRSTNESLETNIWVYFLLYIIFISLTLPCTHLRARRAYTSALGVQVSNIYAPGYSVKSGVLGALSLRQTEVTKAIFDIF